MRHLKDPYEKGKTIVILSKEEIDIIGAALNNRMVYLDKMQKSSFRYDIVMNDKQNKFDITKGFFWLDMSDIERLTKYAEVFHIKGQNGASPARTLWNQLRLEYITNHMK